MAFMMSKRFLISRFSPSSNSRRLGVSGFTVFAASSFWYASSLVRRASFTSPKGLPSSSIARTSALFM